ncbi:MAG: GntR family transcriptional regulator [Desulfobacteraceae bacterium]|nr:GntR family transcriptional regulator [Desulfobacteraceae bacterium]
MLPGLNIDQLVTRSKMLYARLIDRIIQCGGEKLPTSDHLAKEHHVSVNTVKEVCARLAREGYIRQKKRAGTEIRSLYSEEQVQAYLRSREKIVQVFNQLKESGISESGIIAAALSALDEYRPEPARAVYVDKDFYGLVVGKKELESILEVKVSSMFVDELMEKIDTEAPAPELVVTSLRNAPLVEALPDTIRVIPLKTTPPLEQLVDFSALPTDARITLVVISDQVRQRVLATYADLMEAYPFFHVHTLSQVRMNRELVRETTTLVTLRMILGENQGLFSHIPHTVPYNRFHDDEGMGMVKRFLAHGREEA